MTQDVLIVVLAALIGYGTNWLAVKMLFRPHRAVYVRGVRVPFTPGVVPARREEIVEGIADGVARHLLTPEAIEREIGGIDLVGPIERYVREVVERVVQRPETTAEVRQQLLQAVEAIAEAPEVRAAIAERLKPGLRGGLAGAAAGGTMLITALPGVRRLPRKTMASIAAGAAAFAADRVAEELAARLLRSASGSVRNAVAEGVIDAAARDAIQRVPDAIFDPDGSVRGTIDDGLRRAVPEAARAIDVREMVRRRLGTFEVADLEALILSASSTHLRAITVLGGVLGAAVGGLQVVLRHLMT